VAHHGRGRLSTRAAITFALGDRIGRKRSFMVTMVMMGLSTVAVGLLPTYAQVGVWAPVLLVFMRLTQGLAVGFLPFVASALVIYEGNIFAGLWYPVGIALATAVVALLVLPETKDRAIN
jgi:MFS family permease